MKIYARELSPVDKKAIESHLWNLSSSDRFLRFGEWFNNEDITRYVDGINFIDETAWAIASVNNKEIVGLAVVTPFDRYAELRISVLENYRNMGVASEILRRIQLNARNSGIQSLYMRISSNNLPMIHFVKKSGISIARDLGKIDAWIDLKPSDLSSKMAEDYEQLLSRGDDLINRIIGQIA